MKNVYIFNSIRTARTAQSKEGGLISQKPIDIISPLLKQLIKTNNLTNDSIDELSIACSSQVEQQGAQLAFALRALQGLSPSCQSTMLSNGRASAFSAIQSIASKVAANQIQLSLVGALHSSTHQAEEMQANLLRDDPTLFRKINHIPIQLAADCLATVQGYTRRDLDQYAFDSHKRANEAYLQGKSKKSLFILRDTFGQPIASYDELIEENITMEDLAKHRPFYELTKSYSSIKAYEEFPELENIIYLHHKGNSASPVNAASLTLIGSEEAIKEHGLIPRAKIRAMAIETTNKEKQGVQRYTALQRASVKALETANLSIEDIELFEVDESFAAYPLSYIDYFQLNSEKVNVNGGSLATGEANGTITSFMLSSLIDELERRKKRIGLLVHLGEYNQAYCLIVEAMSEVI